MDVEAAWKHYVDTCEEMRQVFLKDPMIQRYPALKANAHFILQQTQALTYMQVMASRSDTPCFYKNNFLEPLLFSGHQPNPDFCYQIAFLNGRRTWKITGRRNTAHWVDIQSHNGWWGDQGFAGIENYDLDHFEIAPDGTFEIIASATPHEGNWIRLDAANTSNTIMVRPAMYDWEREVPPTFHVEPMDDDPAAPIVHDEAEIVRRLGMCAEMMRHATIHWTTDASPRLVRKVGVNQFVVRKGDAKRGGANPLAHYAQGVYELAPDEALIIETDNPRAAYWGISLGTWWWETTNHTNHHSSINGHQARLDGDGRFRAVISRVDPGVPNWLDPICWDVGICLIRWYRPQVPPQLTTRRVKVADVRNHLPADTPEVTPAARRAICERRRRAVLGWYGY